MQGPAFCVEISEKDLESMIYFKEVKEGYGVSITESVFEFICNSVTYITLKVREMG